MLLVQEFLKNKTFGDLVRDHGVYCSFSKTGHKWSLNYDQIEAKESDPLAQECRGLILSCEDGHSLLASAVEINGRKNYDHISPGVTKILAFPMKRFFNHGQGSAASIDFTDPNLQVLEKLDGTLCIVYHDPFMEQWCVATRSAPEADILMDNGIFTFRTLFEKAVQETCAMTFEALSKALDKHYTYCFELTTPYNRIVVNYSNNGITLLAVRGLMTHQELKFDHFLIAEQLGRAVPLVQAHTYTCMSDLVNWVSSLNPMEHEGVVVRDAQFNRIKVKNAAYVAYNKVRDTLAASERNCVELILAEKDDDVVSFLPEEIVKNLQNIKIGVKAFIQEYDEQYRFIRAEANLQAVDDKKAFALTIKSTNNALKDQKKKELWSAPFFQIFDGKASSMKDFIQKSRKDGTWGNGFLDRILELIEREPNGAHSK